MHAKVNWFKMSATFDLVNSDVKFIYRQVNVIAHNLTSLNSYCANFHAFING